MEIINYIYGKTDTVYATPSVMALGFFDGVHLAHRQLIGEASRTAREEGLSLSVFTFSEGSGLKVGAQRIYSDREKLSIFESLGVERAIMCDFRSVKELSAEQFVSDVLIATFGLKYAVYGFNYRCGKGRSAGSSELRKILDGHGIGSLILDELYYRDTTLSSTLIRALLSDGKIEEANRALGEPYFIRGKTCHGLGVGRGMGIPTVNTDTPPERLIVPSGVYLTETDIQSVSYPSLTNVGVCPTFSERPRHAETYILGYSGDLYGEELKIKFLSKLRDEVRFDGEKELAEQINIDKTKALSLYGKLKTQNNTYKIQTKIEG